MRPNALHRAHQSLGGVVSHRAQIGQDKQNGGDEHSRCDERNQHAVVFATNPGGKWALKGKDRGLRQPRLGRGLRRTEFPFGFCGLDAFAPGASSRPN